MRITGGRAKGIPLRVPKGDTVRPTTDRVRQALFNVLTHRFGRPFDEARTLDLFAGAGSLGLEASSHGAKEAVFVEANAKVATVLRQNATKVGGPHRVVQSTVTRFLSGPSSPFDLVFMDPPYAKADVAPILARLMTGGWLAEQAVICVETGAPEDAPVVNGLDLAFVRTYGNTTISIYCL